MAERERASLALGASWSEAELTEEDLGRAAAAVEPLAQRLGVPAALQALAAHTWSPEPNTWPTLTLDDISAIPFLLKVAGVEEYQHRARVRCRAGDLYAAVTAETPGYADYCAQVLGLGAPEFIQAEVAGGPMEVARACASGSAFARICAATRAAGGLNVHPYMGIESVWDLARAVARETGLPVKVCAPPPITTWIANDKGLLSEVVACVLDRGHVVETRSAQTVVELVAHARELASRHARVGLKRTRCASGMGNAHFCSSRLTDPSASRALIEEFLRATEWDGEEQVLVVAWEPTPLSPSTQLWIPPLGAGPPRLDGIYEQLLYGESRVFLGSRPSGLPAPLNAALARASLQVAAAFQALGYVGRCSFDLLVLGDPAGEFQLRFTECNGRWGGTSTPMHLVDRLVSGPRPPYRAQDFQSAELIGVPFAEVLRRVGDELYRPATRSGRFAFYNTGPLAKTGKLDVICFGPTQAAAERGLLEDLPRLLGVG